MPPASGKSFSCDINPFSGEAELLSFFFSQVQDLKNLNGWSDDHALIYTKSKLIGQALQFYINSTEAQA